MNNRYNRQELVIGKKNQTKIKKTTLVIVGVGALGSVSAELAARAGFGHLVLIDRDLVELSNLQRQSLYTHQDLGKPKGHQAKQHLELINPTITITAIADDLSSATASHLSKHKNTLILDCTDNMDTRLLLNDIAVKHKIPLFYSSALRTQGYTFVVKTPNTPCLRCFLTHKRSTETCQTAGVLNTIIHMIASQQLTQVLDYVCYKKIEPHLIHTDVATYSIDKIKVAKKKNCSCCQQKKFDYLDGKKGIQHTRLCGEGMYQVFDSTLTRHQFKNIKNTLKKRVIDQKTFIVIDKKITLFPNGRALIKAKNFTQAKTLYSKIIGH